MKELILTKRYRTTCLVLLGDGHGAGHAGMDGAVVVEGASAIKREGVGAARGDVAAARAGLAVAFGDGVSGAVFVGPGDSCAFFDGDADRAEGEVLDGNTVRAGWGGARTVTAATVRHVAHAT